MRGFRLLVVCVLDRKLGRNAWLKETATSRKDQHALKRESDWCWCVTSLQVTTHCGWLHLHMALLFQQNIHFMFHSQTMISRTCASGSYYATPIFYPFKITHSHAFLLINFWPSTRLSKQEHIGSNFFASILHIFIAKVTLVL